MTSCHRFAANQLRLLLSSAAYVLVESLRRLGLPGTELATAQVGTLRLKLLKIGARITWSVRRMVLHLATGYPLKHLFERVVRRLREPHLYPPLRPLKTGIAHGGKGVFCAAGTQYLPHPPRPPIQVPLSTIMQYPG